jgi:glycosyltransferase involved in cell wall biosynthesis
MEKLRCPCPYGNDEPRLSGRMNKNAVSIVIPAYNAAAFLPETLGSCFAQTSPAAEIVVVDDGSTDSTPELESRYQGRVRWLRQDNAGVSAARNRGAAHCQGDWFLFLDADDRLLPDALEKLISAMNGAVSCPGVVYGMIEEEREPPLATRRNGFDFCAGSPPSPSKANLHRCAIITPGSALIRRDLFLQVDGFQAGTEPMEDRELWLRCGLLAEFVHCPAVVLWKRWVPASHGSQHGKRIYRGWLAKRHLRMWGGGLALPVSWMESDADLLTGAIREAIYWRAYEILEPLLEDAARLHLRNFWTLRATLTLQFFSIFRPRAIRSPEWIGLSAYRLSS